MEPMNQGTAEQFPYNAGSRHWFKVFLIVLVVVLIGAGVTAGVLLTNKEATNQESEATAPSAQIVITADSTTPGVMQVKKGQSVVWLNEDQTPHMLTFSATEELQPEGLTTSEQMNQGESYSYVFDQSGTFNYYDATNPQRLKGVIIVE